jgi:hypothetical protein
MELLLLGFKILDVPKLEFLMTLDAESLRSFMDMMTLITDQRSPGVQVRRGMGVRYYLIRLFDQFLLISMTGHADLIGRTFFGRIFPVAGRARKPLGLMLIA